MGIFRCGALTAVLIGYSMESDGVCGEVIYIWYLDRGIEKSIVLDVSYIGVEKLNCCGWKVSKFVMEVLNEFEM